MKARHTMQAIELLGIPGSPYTRKMLALLRYRRIPHRMVWGSHFAPIKGYPIPKVKLLPTVYFPTANGLEAVVDSTPIIQRLETEYSDRSVIPDHAVLAFLNLLIEDFADEWLTKAMFHYRWHYAEDAEHAAPLISFWQHPQLSNADAKETSAAFAKRQISRLYVVGSTHDTAPVIESSYQRLMGILDRMIARQGFVLGSRPSSADFALYGQLTQLGWVDPTPARILAKNAPRVRAWLDLVDDLSGHSSEQWVSATSMPEHLSELLHEIGRVYAPFFVANAQAAQNNHTEFTTVIDGHHWKQAVFPYQVKCLEYIRHARDALTPSEQQSLDQLLDGTGCELLF